MTEELVYGKWLEKAEEFKQKYYGMHWIGMVLWAFGFAAGIIFLNQSLAVSASIGFLPFFICYLCSFGYYDKWKECELKFRKHIPFIDIKKMNVLIASLEFKPGTVVCNYVRHDGYMETVTLPADKIKICRADDDVDTLQFQKDVNNYSHEESWVFIKICLTAKSQQKLMALTA
ncbi:MAG: hypothetical protein HUJ55_00695 [Ileibacterium sp.]|nr:hypothetical protein [Ileibacterium sp.]